MDEAELRRNIELLEARIEQLGQTIERCHKLILAAKIGVALAALVLSAGLAGAIRVDPAGMIAAMAGVIGGVVLVGANGSTAGQATAALRIAEAERAELIGRVRLQVVGPSGIGKTEALSRGNGRILP